MFFNLKSKKNAASICIFILLLLVNISSLINASDSVEVRNIRYWSSEDYTRVVVDLSRNVEFSANRIINPDRLYFDLMNTVITKEVKTEVQVGDGILRKIRAGQFKPDTVRVVLDLEEIKDYNVFFLDDPARLVVDVYGTGKSIKPGMLTAKRRIVIDPGHGGHDPGAIGPGRIYEKDIVLDIALKLKKILREDPLYEIFLTRETDIYIPLEERTAMANKKNADLFVSIHANASLRRQARGIETYLLNWTDDEEAMRVAARENAISLKKMKAMHRQMDIVKVIMDDLYRQNKRDESIKLANYIQRSMVSSIKSSHDLGVKQALFYVLFGAKMPSVLVEVAFISNPEEEKLLAQESYRMNIAEAIAEGIKVYFDSAPAYQRVTEFKENMLLHR